MTRTENTTPTRDELAERGKLLVRRINHEEYELDGVRYVAGWNSKVTPLQPEPDWVVYRA